MDQDDPFGMPSGSPSEEYGGSPAASPGNVRARAPQPQPAQQPPQPAPGQQQQTNFHASLLVALEVETTAANSEQANAMISDRCKQLIERMDGVPGFTVRVVNLVDPRTGLAGEAFINSLGNDDD